MTRQPSTKNAVPFQEHFIAFAKRPWASHSLGHETVYCCIEGLCFQVGHHCIPGSIKSWEGCGFGKTGSLGLLPWAAEMALWMGVHLQREEISPVLHAFLRTCYASGIVPGAEETRNDPNSVSPQVA